MYVINSHDNHTKHIQSRLLTHTHTYTHTHTHTHTNTHTHTCTHGHSLSHNTHLNTCECACACAYLAILNQRSGLAARMNLISAESTVLCVCVWRGWVRGWCYVHMFTHAIINCILAFRTHCRRNWVLGTHLKTAFRTHTNRFIADLPRIAFGT